MATDEVFNLDTLKKMYENVFDSTFVYPYSDERNVWKIPALLMGHMDWPAIYKQDVERATIYANENGMTQEQAMKKLVYQEDAFQVFDRLVDEKGLADELVETIKTARDNSDRFANVTDLNIEKEVRETLPDMIELINTREVLKNIERFNRIQKEKNMEELEEKGFSLEALKGAYEQILQDHGGVNYPYYVLPEMPWEQVYNESREAFLNEVQGEPDFTFDDFAELMLQAGAEQLVDQYIDTEKQQEMAVKKMKEYVDFDSRYENVTDDALKEYFASPFNNTVEAYAEPFDVLDSIQAELLDKEEEEKEKYLINPAAKDQPLAIGLGTDKHLFDEYEEAYINTGQSSRFQAPEELFDRNGNMYNDEIDIDELVDRMQAYAETELGNSQERNDQKGLSKKQTKALKRDIVEEGALQIGYLQGVKAKMLELDPDIIEKTIASAGGWVGESLTLQADEVPQRGEFDNILVTEMVRNLNYQDFKEVAPFFFQYSSMIAENGQTEIIGKDIDMAAATLQKHIEEGALDNGVHFELPKTTASDLVDGYDIVAYNPIEQRSITVDMAKDGKQFELSVANQFGEKMGQPVFVSEEDFNNSIIASDKIHELLVMNGIEKQTANRFASMEVIDRLQESGLSFSKADLDEALKEPQQLQSVEKLIEKNQVSEQVTVRSPIR